MTSTGITNYVDFIRQAISERSNVRPERADTGDPSIEVFNIRKINPKIKHIRQ